jgi:hypothetical protein
MRFLLLLSLEFGLVGGFSMQEKAQFVLRYERNSRQYEPFKTEARNSLRERGVTINRYTDRLIPPRSTLNDWVKLLEET